MSLRLSKWYNNYQAPSVLMVDDLNDVYIQQYEASYKNDWGYLGQSKGSIYTFLEEKLLVDFPEIKMTFFVPYLKHNVVNENAKIEQKKHAIGEREEFTLFLKELIKQGHEISHHGSNHGEYIDANVVSTVNNFKHEWELFDHVDKGVNVTKQGVEVFKKYLDFDVVGGKFCGYRSRENSLEIIDKCNFEYWCDKVNFNTGSYKEEIFGENKVLSFPTNFAGNAFVRLSYITGDRGKDKKKRMTKYFQFIYNLFQYKRLRDLYKNGEIMSIQEHISPATSSGLTQSTNLVSDIESLRKIYTFFSEKSIWYATCKEISRYIYVRENCSLKIENEILILEFNNYKKLDNLIVSIEDMDYFELIDAGKKRYKSKKNRDKYVVNLDVFNPINRYKVERNEK
jgi:hypothetical protein